MRSSSPTRPSSSAISARSSRSRRLLRASTSSSASSVGRSSRSLSSIVAAVVGGRRPLLAASRSVGGATAEARTSCSCSASGRSPSGSRGRCSSERARPRVPVRTYSDTAWYASHSCSVSSTSQTAATRGMKPPTTVFRLRIRTSLRRCLRAELFDELLASLGVVERVLELAVSIEPATKLRASLVRARRASSVGQRRDRLDGRVEAGELHPRARRSPRRSGRARDREARSASTARTVELHRRRREQAATTARVPCSGSASISASL